MAGWGVSPAPDEAHYHQGEHDEEGEVGVAAVLEQGSRACAFLKRGAALGAGVGVRAYVMVAVRAVREGYGIPLWLPRLLMYTCHIFTSHSARLSFTRASTRH